MLHDRNRGQAFAFKGEDLSSVISNYEKGEKSWRRTRKGVDVERWLNSGAIFLSSDFVSKIIRGERWSMLFLQGTAWPG